MTPKTPFKNFDEFVQRLKEIKDMGFVKTHRSGNTGVGKTLEGLLGIEENNIPSPNAVNTELKSARRNAKSMLTLFTKSPLPRSANTAILKQHGYPSKKKNKKNELHTTVNAKTYNTIKGRTGFKIEFQEDRIELVSSNQPLGYWPKETLQSCFEEKLPKVCYVKAEAKGQGKNEEFYYTEAWLLSGFSFENFIKLLESGDILVDVRIGQNPDGTTHDHGTGFRVSLNKLDLCFLNREKLM